MPFQDITRAVCDLPCKPIAQVQHGVETIAEAKPWITRVPSRSQMLSQGEAYITMASVVSIPQRTRATSPMMAADLDQKRPASKPANGRDSSAPTYCVPITIPAQTVPNSSSFMTMPGSNVKGSPLATYDMKLKHTINMIYIEGCVEAVVLVSKTAGS